MASNRTLLRLHLSASTFALLAALVMLLAQPADPKNAWLLGLSRSRWLMAGALLLGLLLFGRLAWRAWRNQTWGETLAGNLARWLGNSITFAIVLLVTLGLFLAGWAAFFLPEERAIELLGNYALYSLRLKPFFFALTFLAAFSIILTFALRFGVQLVTLNLETPTLRAAGLVFVGLLLLLLISALTGLGRGFDRTEWNAPGAPVLVGQVALSVLLALAVTVLLVWRGWEKANWVDVALFAFVWVLAAGLWLAQPETPNYYAAAPGPPNQEFYPLSDAFNHDVIAQNVLIGEGFRFGSIRVTRKPLYTLFLAGLHALTGSNYAAIVRWQVVVMALFPALVYLLGARLHSRLAGMLVSGVLILREVNALQLSDVLNISHVKLLMAEYPVALGLALLALVLIAWLKKPAERRGLPLLGGGVLGLLMITRSQTLTLLPVLLVVIVLARWGEWRRGLVSGGFFLAGVLLAVTPWVARNYVYTGHLILEHSTATPFVAARYSPNNDYEDPGFLPGETEGDYITRNMAYIRSVTREDPLYVAEFVIDNYARNLLVDGMSLPSSLQLYERETYVRTLPYWPRWDGHFAPESYLPVTVNLLLIAVGLAAAWQRQRWAGLLPLFILLGFTLNLAAARVSGWRYNLPTDWVLIFYYALGIGQVLTWGAAVLGWRTSAAMSVPAEASARPLDWRRIVLVGALILLAGSSLLLAAALVPQRYTNPTTAEVTELLVASGGDTEAVRDLLAEADTVAYAGRALYPRYFAAGRGDPVSDLAKDAVQDYDRVGFYLIGPDPWNVVLPVADAALSFPYKTDAIVIGCREGGLLKAAAVILTGGDDLRVVSAPDIADICR
ncbi:MAG: hypothetical protein JXB38_05390 [Anaerolineales bacterium]|nr:hypothetical protein [Anaerolineales bacterium]